VTFLIAIGTEELGFFRAVVGEMTGFFAPATCDASKVLGRQRFRTLARMMIFRTKTSTQLDTNEYGGNEIERFVVGKTRSFDNNPLWDNHGPYVPPP